MPWYQTRCDKCGGYNGAHAGDCETLGADPSDGRHDLTRAGATFPLPTGIRIQTTAAMESGRAFNARYRSAMAALATDSAARKATPICSGVLDYFPLALAAVARLSKVGNDKHNPGQSLHWSRDKSTDHADCIMRHMIDRGTIDPDSGELHEVGVAWRALAQLQLAEEKRINNQGDK